MVENRSSALPTSNDPLHASQSFGCASFLGDMMKLLINKRKFLVLLLILTTVVWLVPGVFAAPQADGVVPTPRPGPRRLP